MTAAQQNSGASPAALLAQAQQVLSAAPEATSGNAARLAAVLARQSLEAEIDRRCLAAQIELGQATMRSRLLVLRGLAARDPDHNTSHPANTERVTAERLSLLWSQLSACCHHHAYELSPTVAEVRNLCTELADLLTQQP